MTDHLSFRALHPFGVEIDRDLSRPLGADEAEQFRALFNAHALIVARGQTLDMARHRALCAELGPILDRAGENGVLTNAGGGAAASEYAWHSDAAYTEHPFDALSLHALDVVDDASSTRFVSAERGWAALPERLRAVLADARQDMISPHYTRLAERACDSSDPEATTRAERPAVFTNPHNGRACVWVGAMQTARLRDHGREEGRALLHEVFDRLYAPERVFEHRWRRGDLIVWDNIALQHMRGDVSAVGARVLQRVIVGTQGAVLHLAM